MTAAAQDQYTPNTPQRGNSCGELVAKETLLRREFAALRRIDAVLTQAIWEEEALGIEVCSGAFAECLHALDLLALEIAKELARIAKQGKSDRSEGAAVPSSH